jgi:hypothetical protein
LICQKINRFQKVIDFGFTPWSNNFIKKKKELKNIH